jgi:hypothetical protein
MFLFFKHYLFEYTGKVPRTVEYHYTFDSSTLLTTIPLCKLKINRKKVKRIFLILRNILFTKQVFRLPICYVWGGGFQQTVGIPICTTYVPFPQTCSYIRIN